MSINQPPSAPRKLVLRAAPPQANPELEEEEELAFEPDESGDKAPSTSLSKWKHGTARAKAQAYVKQLGLSEPERPTNETGAYSEPSLPSDITKIDIDDLGRLHGEFVAWADYIDFQLSLVEIDSDEDESVKEEVEARVKLEKSGKNVDIIRAKTAKDPDYLEKAQRAFISKAKTKLLKVKLRAMERGASACSRELTRRTEKAAMGGRPIRR